MIRCEFVSFFFNTVFVNKIRLFFLETALNEEKKKIQVIFNDVHTSFVLNLMLSPC